MGKYYMTKESVEEYIRMAGGHDGGQIIEKIEKFLAAGASMLELGSGPGTDWKILDGRYKVCGSDLSPEFLEHLRANFPQGEFIQLDASTLNIDRSFDAIYSNKVLHHLEDEQLEISIRRQHEILNPGGVVCHTFWKGEDSETHKGLFVNYHTDTGLISLFGELFKVLLLQHYKEFEQDDSLLFVGVKKDRTI